MKFISVAIVSVFIIGQSTVLSSAENIPYYPKIDIKVGQTATLKGVRGACDATKAPKFWSLFKLPKLRTGVLLDGGHGEVNSGKCKKMVPARAILFKATKRGNEKVTIYKDKFSIRVR